MRGLILTGNDHDEDSDKEPEPPTKVVDKPISRSSKRDTPDIAPGGGHERNDRGGRGGQRGGFSGNDEGLPIYLLNAFRPYVLDPLM